MDESKRTDYDRKLGINQDSIFNDRVNEFKRSNPMSYKNYNRKNSKINPKHYNYDEWMKQHYSESLRKQYDVYRRSNMRRNHYSYEYMKNNKGEWERQTYDQHWSPENSQNIYRNNRSRSNSTRKGDQKKLFFPAALMALISFGILLDLYV